MSLSDLGEENRRLRDTIATLEAGLDTSDRFVQQMLDIPAEQWDEARAFMKEALAAATTALLSWEEVMGRRT
jgi:hypothetical protein